MEADTEKRLGLECKKPEQEEERVGVAESARADFKIHKIFVTFTCSTIVRHGVLHLT